MGPILAAVFVAEIGDITRFQRPEQVASWAGLTPTHHESDTTVHRGRITKQGSRLVRWAAVEAVQRVSGHNPAWATPRPVRRASGPQHRVVAAARDLTRLGVLRATRSPHPMCTCPTRGSVTRPDFVVGADRDSHDPRTWFGVIAPFD